MFENFYYKMYQYWLNSKYYRKIQNILPPPNSILVYSCYSDDIIRDENKIKKVFAEKFLKRSDLGVEYFEGDLC